MIGRSRKCILKIPCYIFDCTILFFKLSFKRFIKALLKINSDFSYLKLNYTMNIWCKLTCRSTRLVDLKNFLYSFTDFLNDILLYVLIILKFAILKRYPIIKIDVLNVLKKKKKVSKEICFLITLLKEAIWFFIEVNYG